jgi:hypothetical protein|tara:strand:- start:890 stop:1114 length:225 start_codon:yes stop_codon:yes gene_type:complete
MQVGDLIKCADGGLYIVSAITEEAYRYRGDSGGEVIHNVARYADLVDAATLETGAVIRIDDNPHYEIVSSRDHS